MWTKFENRIWPSRRWRLSSCWRLLAFCWFVSAASMLICSNTSSSVLGAPTLKCFKCFFDFPCFSTAGNPSLTEKVNPKGSLGGGGHVRHLALNGSSETEVHHSCTGLSSTKLSNHLGWNFTFLPMRIFLLHIIHFDSERMKISIDNSQIKCPALWLANLSWSENVPCQFVLAACWFE